MAPINDYIADLANIQRLYLANWVLPYGSAYALAFENFNKTLNSQREFDKFKAELLTMAVTLGIGGGLGALFGKATMRAVVVDQAVNFVCNRNMARTFNAMARVSSSPAGRFIAEQSWDNIATLLGKQVEQQVEGLVSRPPLGANTIQNPQVLQNDLEAYVLRAIAAAHDVATSIRDNHVMTLEWKDEVARDLRAARFFKDAPKFDVTGNRDNAAKDIELSLYMVLVMDSDYIQERTFWMRGAQEGTSTRRIGPVDQATTSANYPTTSTAHSHGAGYVRDTIRTVEYDSPGSRVMSRINDLHRERLGSNFQMGSYGRDEVARAENVSSRLQQTYLRMI